MAADMAGVSPFWPQHLRVRGVVADGGGYTVNLRAIVHGLVAQGVAVQVVDERPHERRRIAASELAPYARALPEARIALQVIQPLWIKDLRAVNVNYAMFEGDRLPDAWRSPVRAMPLSIVPSRHCEALWLEAGAAPERVRIVPHGIDGARFAAPCDPLPVPPALDGRSVADRRVRVLTRAGTDVRKNLVGLMQAWIAATRANDDAVLIIKGPRSRPGEADLVAAEIAAGEARAGRTLADAAPVVVWRDHLADADMPRLYAAATHFISASYGEGWDLPMTEAGAAGLTLIAPDHTGYREYLDPSVATMIPTALVAVEPGAGHGFDGLRWWKPDHAELVAAIRAAVAGDAMPRGAQERILRDFTVQRATITLLDAIGAVLPDVVAGARPDRLSGA